MLLTGACHCGRICWQLDWPGHADVIPARRCGCTYCTRFNGTWTSHPDAALTINGARAVLDSAYRFATATADFLFCPDCGITVAALCETGGVMRAVVNINTLDDNELIFDRSDSDFDLESRQQRLDRRRERWIGQVTLS